MTNRIKVADGQAQAQALRAKLDELAGSRTQIKASEIKDDPLLFGLAKTVFTGCGAMDKVSVAQLRKALTAVGASLVAADANKDGEVGYAEAKGLSALAVRLLDRAAGDEGGPAKTTKKATTKKTTAKKAPVKKKPVTVSSGCGASAPAPKKIVVSSGC